MNWLRKSDSGEPQAAQGRPFGVSVMAARLPLEASNQDYD